jgi:hypothetical protein
MANDQEQTLLAQLKTLTQTKAPRMTRAEMTLTQTQTQKRTQTQRHEMKTPIIQSFD